MISPVSTSATASLQELQSLSKPQPAPAPAQSSKTADTVQLSPQAKAAMSGGDVDHDGDSH